MNQDKIIHFDQSMDIQSFVDMKKSKRFKDFGNYHIHFEGIIDMRQESPFLVMIYTDATGTDNQNFICLNFDGSKESDGKSIKDEWYILQECIEPINENKKELYAQDVAILRSSDRYEYKLERGEYTTFITKYQYIFAFDT